MKRKKSEQVSQKSFAELLDVSNFNAAQLLIEGGENIDGFDGEISDYDGCYPKHINYLQQAFIARRLDIADFLLSKGAFLGAAFKSIVTGLRFESPDFSYKALLLLGKHNARLLINMQIDGYGSNLLHLLSERRVQEIYSRDSSIFTVDNSFSIASAYKTHSLIFPFTQEQFVEIARLYKITASAYDRIDKEGNTPIEKARQNDNVPLVNMLEQVQKQLLSVVSGNVNALYSTPRVDVSVTPLLTGKLGAN